MNDRNIVAGEVVAGQQLTDFHLDEFDDLFVIDHVALIECDNQGGNANLLGEQDVLFGLGHGAVCGCTDEDGAIHLRCTRNHVFHVVRVTRAVNVGVVALIGFVLNVSSIDGDAALALLRSSVNIGIVLNLSHPFLGEHVCDRSGEGGFAVVNVANGADVDVGLVPFELLASHFGKESRGELRKCRDQELP